MRISKNVFFMGLTSFLVDVHSEIIMPLLPLFLTSVLGVSMAFVGLIEGIADAAASVLKAPSGWLSDKLKKRKPITFFGYALSTLCKPLLFFARTGGAVLFIRFGDRMGKGIRTAPRDALIADSCESNEKGRAFGFHRAMDTCGAVLGAGLASLLMILCAGNYKQVFLLAAIPGFLALVIFAVFVKEIKPPHYPRPLTLILSPEGRGQGEGERVKDSSLARPISGELKFFLAVATIFSLGNFSYVFFVLGAKELGIAAAYVPIIYLFYNVVYAAVAHPAGVLSDKLGRKPLLIAGYAAFALLCFGFANAKSQPFVWLLFAVYGVHSGIIESVSRAFVSDMAPAQSRAPLQNSRKFVTGRATALGIYHMLVGVAVLPASLIAGRLWDAFGRQGCFYYGAVLSSIACVMLSCKVKSK